LPPDCTRVRPRSERGHAGGDHSREKRIGAGLERSKQCLCGTRDNECVTARVLDGKAVAQQILDDIATKVGARVAMGKPRPKLATVIEIGRASCRERV